MIQFVAFISALVAGRLADRMGHKKIVGFTIAMFLVAVIWGAVMRTQAEFWALGVLVGLVMGGNQSASRSFYSLLIPEEKAGELFALFSVVRKGVVAGRAVRVRPQLPVPGASPGPSPSSAMLLHRRRLDPLPDERRARSRRAPFRLINLR